MNPSPKLTPKKSKPEAGKPKRAKRRHTLDADLFLDALNRATEFQREQPMNGVEVVIALTEVRDAVRYALQRLGLGEGEKTK